MSSEQVRYGIVGLGRAGWDIHVRQLRGRPDAKIVAVADPEPVRRQQAVTEFGCTPHENIDQLVKQADIDVVVVATPSFLHGPDAKKAIAAGKHAVVEKPMAMSVEEAKSMVAAAGAAGKKLFVHQNYRFYRDFTFLQDTVASGILGKVYHIRCYMSGFSRRNDWQTLAKNGGGVLNNTCPHFVDQVLQLLGSPVKTVVGDLQQIVSSGDVEDHVKMFIRAENGVTADLESTTAQNIAVAVPRWIIAGSTGTLTVMPDQSATINFFDPSQVQPLPVIDGPATDRRYGNDDKLPWQKRETKAEGTDVGNFYDNVFAVLKKGAPMRVTPESVLEVMRVLDLTRVGTKFPGKPA